MERVIIAGLTVYANDYGCVSRPRVLLGSRWHPSHLKWALLGRMRPKAFNVIFENERNRNTVQDAVHDVAAADAKDFPGAAIQAYQKITGITNLGPATATRLLALSRPDRIVSFNKASRKGLAKYFNLDLGGQLSAEKYRSVLDSLYEKPWFNAPRPEAPREYSIWLMRAALMDCFVYDGGRPDRPSNVLG